MARFDFASPVLSLSKGANRVFQQPVSFALPVPSLPKGAIYSIRGSCWGSDRATGASAGSSAIRASSQRM